MKNIPDFLLDHPIEGVNLSGQTLKEELGDFPKLLVFVRHFGCIFCRELIADLRNVSENQPQFPPIIFFYQGTVSDGRDFFASLWREAKAIADLPKVFYNGFELERGGVKEMFGAEVWACGVRAALKGHFIGAPVGDPWTMPGIFFVQHHQILWQHHFKHAGDHPTLENLVRELNNALNQQRETAS
ncbi:MAG: SelL-related redox protein [Chlorobiales bacterium]